MTEAPFCRGNAPGAGKNTGRPFQATRSLKRLTPGRRQGFGDDLFAVDHLGEETLAIDVAVLVEAHVKQHTGVLLQDFYIY